MENLLPTVNNVRTSRCVRIEAKKVSNAYALYYECKNSYRKKELRKAFDKAESAFFNTYGLHYYSVK